MTKEQLLAANERLAAEVAAHRALLAAIRELATIPKAARWDDARYVTELESKLNTLRAYAGHVDQLRADIIPAVLHDRAQQLREEAAQPVRYALKDAEPAAAPERLHPHCEHCGPECDGSGEGHKDACATLGCPSGPASFAAPERETAPAGAA